MDLTSPDAALRRRRRLQARLLGLAVAAVGLLNLISALTPELRDRLELMSSAVAPPAADIAAGATALLGVALLLLGRGLAHRRRAAYRLAIAVLSVSAVTHLAKGLDVEEALVVIAVAVLLVRSRHLFDAAVPPVRATSALRWAPIVLGLTAAYGLIGLVLRRGAVTPDLTPVLAIREVGARMLGFSGPLVIAGRFGEWFPASITVLGFAGVVALVLMVLAPAAEHAVAHQSERDRVRELMARDDGDTLDPFALRHDKRYVFSTDGRAAIAYRYVNGVGLASGDPIGDPASARDAVRCFLDRCEAHGWRPAAMGVRCDRLTLWTDEGMRAHYLGDEAIIDVADFSLDGRAMRPVRQAANRTRNYGITTEIHLEGELEPTLRRALQGIAETHRDGAPERGFSMALDGLLSGRDADSVVIVARDADGAPFAFQRYVPCRLGRGLSLDAMRRDHVGPNGVNERMIVDVIEWAREHGVDEVSLNFATFKDLVSDEADARGFGAAVEAWIVRRLDPHFQIGSLLSFNAKFAPRWVPRHVVYRSVADLGAVGLAAASAEGFVPLERRVPEPERRTDDPAPTPSAA